MESKTDHSANLAVVDAGSYPRALLCMYGDSKWIIDSDATHYIISIFGSLNRTKDVSDHKNNQVQLPNMKSVGVSRVGSTNILANHAILNVLYLLDFKVNLLLVSKITKELQCMVEFFPDFCIFQDLYTDQVKEISKDEHGLYILREGPIQSPKKLVNVCSDQHVSQTSLTSVSSIVSADVRH